MLDRSASCGDCLALYRMRQPPEEPPCGTCRVVPMEENESALRVFFEVKYQFIMGFDGPIDLNHLAIEAAMQREGVTDRACFERVCALGRWWIQKLREKHES